LNKIFDVDTLRWVCKYCGGEVCKCKELKDKAMCGLAKAVDQETFYKEMEVKAAEKKAEFICKIAYFGLLIIIVMQFFLIFLIPVSIMMFPILMIGFVVVSAYFTYRAQKIANEKQYELDKLKLKNYY